MNLYNLRIINSLLFLLAGLTFGLLLRAHRGGKPPGVPPAEMAARPALQPSPPPRPAAAGSPAAASVPVILPDSGAGAFFLNPDEYVNSELELELKLMDIEKGGDDWRLKMGYLVPGSGIKQVVLDAPAAMPELAGLSPGGFYMVRFRCRAGDLSAGNRAVSISPAGGPAPGAPRR